MAAAIHRMPRQSRPSEAVVPGLLEGLSNVARLVSPWVEPAAQQEMAQPLTHIRRA
jgi:hypothetical protein